jgi:hypothetical protein
MSSASQLVCVPPVQPFESVSGWICRLALSQGVTPSEICDFLDVSEAQDVDRVMFGPRLAQLQRDCGLPDTAFHVHDKVITSLQKLSNYGQKLLALQGRKMMRYRYCTLCLQEMREPFFPIHWRFVAWRWCPLHRCLMESLCPKCNSPVLLLRDLASSGFGSMSRCLECGARLTSRSPLTFEEIPADVISLWEDRQLQNGRAVLAALYYGKFDITGLVLKRRYRSLERALTACGVSTKFDYISADTVRQRMALLKKE